MCEININECEPYPCLNIATCIDGLNNFTCVCATGFEGNASIFAVVRISFLWCLMGGGGHKCTCLFFRRCCRSGSR